MHIQLGMPKVSATWLPRNFNPESVVNVSHDHGNFCMIEQDLTSLLVPTVQQEHYSLSYKFSPKRVFKCKMISQKWTSWCLLPKVSRFQPSKMMLVSQGLGIYNTLLLPCGKGQLLQRRGRVYACRSSNLGSIPSWGRLKYVRSTTMAPTPNNPSYDRSVHKYPLGLISRDSCSLKFRDEWDGWI